MPHTQSGTLSLPDLVVTSEVSSASVYLLAEPGVTAPIPSSRSHLGEISITSPDVIRVASNTHTTAVDGRLAHYTQGMYITPKRISLLFLDG